MNVLMGASGFAKEVISHSVADKKDGESLTSFSQITLGAVITDLWGEKVEHVKREPRNDRKATYLRLLPTFASALQGKTHTCASFTKILANYISEESLITADYHKNII